MPLKPKLCSHLAGLNIILPDKNYCELCAESGEKWVHLRKCQLCGVTLCCDSSVNQHARRHYQETGHATIISAEPGEHWSYCYQDQQINMKAF